MWLLKFSKLSCTEPDISKVFVLESEFGAWLHVWLDTSLNSDVKKNTYKNTTLIANQA